MRYKLTASRSVIATGLLAGTTGLAMLAAVPAAAQDATADEEECTRFADGSYQCFEPATGDFDVASSTDVGAFSDGFYDNLDEKIEDLAPTAEEEAAAAAATAAAAEAAADANATNDAVIATLTEENLAAFDAVDAAAADLAAAEAAEAAAAAELADAQAVFDAAADALTAAGDVVTDAQVVVATADAAVDAAQAAFDADQSTENLATLNAALADQADAEQDLAAAEAARADALAAANATTADLAAAQDAFDAADAAELAAATAVVDAQDDLSTSLASNDDFVDAITVAGQPATAAGLIAVADAADAADADLAIATAFEAGIDDATNTLVRARDVLVPAAENQNAAIAAASQALLGDSRADETDFDVEVVAALVDHEDRITTNEGNIEANTVAIAAETEARIAGDAALLEQLTAEENARIAADTALSNQITGLTGRVDAIEAEVALLDDKIASATATAIALGGMGFLPDTRFNLAVAGGFYEGEQAIAANLGVRVSDNIAVTAGIGGGISGDGDVGGRVGVIFGW